MNARKCDLTTNYVYVSTKPAIKNKLICKGWTLQRENQRWVGKEINRFANTFSPFPLCPGSRYSSSGFPSAWEQGIYENRRKVHSALSRSSGNPPFLFSNLVGCYWPHGSSCIFFPFPGGNMLAKFTLQCLFFFLF